MLKILRITASFLMVAVLIGMVADGVRAAEMALTPAVSMSADGGMPDCDWCGGGDDATAICAVYCSSNSASAMALLPAQANVLHLGSANVGVVIVRLLTGSDAPPDPFPPKSSVLS
ncbi:MAG: hypothetical protein ACE5EU_13385 [Paracoccaceae bacterium]